MQHEPNPEPRFEVVTGECRFFLGERQLYATREQAFLFDSQTGTMLKHGAQADVLAKHKECVAAYQAIGVDIQDLLAEMGLSFGMDLSRFYQPKTPPTVEG